MLRLISLVIVGVLFASSVIFCAESNPYQHERYDELVNTTLKLNTESMAAFMDAMKSFILYTSAQNVPGTVESGVGYYYDSKGKKMRRVLFYRIGSGYPRETNNPLDIKIHGSGFFVIQLPGGWPAYTRDGRFDIDHKGRLVTFANRFPVLGENGIIHIPNRSIRVTKQGAIIHNEEVVDVFKIVMVRNTTELKSFNQAVFYLTKEDLEKRDKFVEPSYTLLQGFVEDSSITKAYIGLVPEWKNGHEVNVKMIKSYVKNMTAAVQQANP